MIAIPDEVILAYALENALKHKGKASPGAVLSCLFNEGLDKSEIPMMMPSVNTIVTRVNAWSLSQQQDEFALVKDKVSKREVRVGLPPLSNAVKGSVVMRVAPFPSGPLHIGNARPLILNDEYAKRYDGKLLLIIDDTIGSVEKPIEPEAYKLIPEGASWLGASYDKTIIYKSDRLPTYYAYAEELIRKGYMYVCNCSREEISSNKEKGLECSCRQFTAPEQLKRWTAMFLAPEGSMCVRLKTSMQDADPAFRDRIMFRISDRPHARMGTKFRVYPLLDFCWAIDDHLLGVTHILRGMELVMETRVEKFIWDIFKWPHPEVIHHGHFAIEGVKISKSKGSAEVRAGTYRGWNDPRTWSLQSLRDRGIQPDAIRQFIINLGLNKTSITTPIEVLYTLNKKLLEGVPRYFFVEDPKPITIAACPPLKAHIPLHPNGSLGFKEYVTGSEFLLSAKDVDSMKSGNYRLMHLLNMRLDDLGKLRQRSFSFISEDPNPELKVKFVHWLVNNVDNIPVTIVMPDGSKRSGLGEPKLRDVKVGEIVQFERVGFVRLHRIDDDTLEFWFAHD